MVACLNTEGDGRENSRRPRSSPVWPRSSPAVICKCQILPHSDLWEKPVGWAEEWLYIQGCQFRFPYGGDKCPMGWGLARDLRQSRELKKLGFQMLKKRLFVKQNHFIG